MPFCFTEKASNCDGSCRSQHILGEKGGIPMLSAFISLALEHLLYLALHLENIGSFPKPLSAADEKKYFARYATGDQQARNTLIEHNLRLVAHIVKKYYTVTNEQEDLISIGTIGLIKAVNTFSYEKGTRFATYASRCIENQVLMHFRNAKKTAGDVYINDPIETDKDGNALTLIDIVADEGNIIDDIDLKLKSEQLHRMIKRYLNDREQYIIRLRYGIGGRKPLTQREVAAKMDISRSYVSRIEKKALEKLRRQFEGKEFSGKTGAK